MTRFISRLEDIGLSLSTGKCEVLTLRLGTPDLTSLHALLSDVQQKHSDSAQLLGSPLTEESVEASISQRELALHVMIKRLHYVEPHHAFFP